MNNRFSISTDSCVDHFRSYLKQNDIDCIILKRITDGMATEEMYDSFSEYENFYNQIRQGALPTTSLLNEYELKEFFQRILAKTKGDIIHLALSSGLSGTCQNAINAAAALNSTLNGRKIYVLDSLSASRGMSMLLDRLIQMRDSGFSAEQAFECVSNLIAHQQVWAIIGDLKHLKRGGRISGFKSMIGTLLSIKPILTINSIGKLTIEKTTKGEKKSIDYILQQMDTYGAKANPDFQNQTIYVLHSSESALMTRLIDAIKEKYPKIKIDIGMIGPIIGTHVGDGTVGVIFEGSKRLTTKD